MSSTDTTTATRTKGHRNWPTPRTWLRVVSGIAAAVVAGHAAFAAFIIGAIVTTGCLMECSTPDPVAGVPILALSVVLFLLGLAALWWAFVNKHWRIALMSIGAIGVIIAIALALMF